MNSKLLPKNWNDMNEMDRRSFLECALKLTAMLSASGSLKPTLAQAQTTYANRPTRFVHFFIRSGSCQLSSYLAPTASTANLADLTGNTWKNPGLATSFRPSTPAKAAIENVDYTTSPSTYGVQAQGSQPIYHARTAVGSYFMPLLWSSTIPVGTGTGTASMKNLISTNCALLYGLESAPAHIIAENMILDPEPGSTTIGGYIAGVSGQSFFPAIGNTGGVRPFKTASGGGIRLFTANNSNGGPAKDLLRAVMAETNDMSSAAVDPATSRRNWFNHVRGKMLESVESMRISNMLVRPGVTELYKMLNQAQTSVDTAQFQAVMTDFDDTQEKYELILARAQTMAVTNMQGISDPTTVANNPIINREKLRNHGGLPPTVSDNTLRSISNIAQLFSGVSSLTASPSFSYLFAMAEVALRHNLTHVLQLGLGESMVHLKYVVNTANNSVPLTGASFDNHERGVVSNLISNAAFYYIFNTMLYELKRNLQGLTSNTSTATNVPIAALASLNQLSDGTAATPPPPSPDPWRDTVILVNTEFSRNPNGDGAGSQHGYTGSSVAIFSGRISGNLKIYGKTTYGNSDYPGCWGKGSSQMIQPDGRQISTKDVGANLAALFCPGTPPLGLQTILARSPNLFSLNSSGNIEFNAQTLPAYGLVST